MRWLPLVVIVSAEVVIVANLVALSLSIGAILADFGTTATSVQSALVVCSLVTAAFMILAAKAGDRYGSMRLFRGGVLILAIALAGVVLSRGPAMLVLAEGLAGAASAALLPAIIALLDANYHGSQRALAIGVVSAVGGSFAMLLAGVLGTVVGWRLPFAILAAVAVLALVASRRLEPSAARAGVVIDWIGVVLSASAIVLLTVGVNGVASWGFLLAKDTAPFDVLGLSPSFILIVVGLVLGWVFFAHQDRRAACGGTPLVSPKIVEPAASRRALVAVAITLAVSAGYGFLLPLYMQVVQGYDSLGTAIRMLPYALSLSAAAILVTRLVGPFTVRRIARSGLVVMALGLCVVGAGIENHWASAPVLLGLIVAGLGTGAVLTMVSDVLFGASGTELAGEAGAVRNTVSNLGTAIGTAIAGALLIGLLSLQVNRDVASSRVLSADVVSRLKVEQPQFISNRQLEREARKSGLGKAQVDELVRINVDARLTALRLSFFALAALALIGALAGRGLPEEAPTA
jgi:MFS family permease